MIYKLRRKFIQISTISIAIVFSAVFLIICMASIGQLNRTVDTLTDAIASNDGFFPEFNAANSTPPENSSSYTEVITEETQYSTRFFTLWLDEKDHIVNLNMDSIFSISEEQAQEYAETALAEESERGWISEYRYKVFDTDKGKAIVFVNGAMNRMQNNRFLLTALGALIVCALLVIVLIILISKRAVQPIAESYEKQKQFITDANHELKTPLTLILSNLDIVEAECGKNEWLDDIRSEGERMGMLINQLVTLTRMDEDKSNLTVSEFDLSNAAADSVSEFVNLAEEKHKTLTYDIEPNMSYEGDEGLIRRLLAILLDNAVKYCDEGGEIKISVYEKRYPIIIVENTYHDVDNIELDRLFDRFYRADKARTFNGSFGIGLSIAKSIARIHQGNISAYKKEGVIGFKVELK
ncbi:MAG: HAMP domain-containing histidine kinase [Clostridiales bacterium]|nr:HAMP domain-containing histidine kinase [Clostridiales bacterium]